MLFLLFLFARLLLIWNSKYSNYSSLVLSLLIRDRIQVAGLFLLLINRFSVSIIASNKSICFISSYKKIVNQQLYSQGRLFQMISWRFLLPFHRLRYWSLQIKRIHSFIIISASSFFEILVWIRYKTGQNVRKKPWNLTISGLFMVRVTGFEPAASWTPF